MPKRTWFLVTAVAMLTLSNGCRTLSPRAIDAPRDHILMFDTEGQASDPTGNHACSEGVRGSTSETRGSVQSWCEGEQWSLRSQPWLSEGLYTSQRREVLAGLQEYAVHNESRRLLIFVHGGLNPRSSSLERAEELVRLIEGDEAESTAYPLFVNWRSSLRSSYRDHLCCVRQGKNLGPKKALWAAPFLLLGDVVRGVLRIPTALGNEIKNATRACNRCSLNENVERVEEELVNGGGKEAGIAIHPGEECDPRGLRTAARTASLLVSIPTVKLITAPTIDTVGVASWSMMRRRTGLLFYTENELRREQMVPSVAGTAHPQGHLSLFLRDLGDWLEEREAEKEPWTVDLVGHSMGTIVINEIVREFGHRLPIRNIVYMAAACSLEDYHQTIIPYLVAHPETRMYHLTLHPKAELRERHFWDLPPRGSLLVWLDDFLTPSETPFERRAGRYDNLLRVVHLTPPDVTDQLHIKAFGLGRCVVHEPQQHGDFGGKLRFWDPKCWTDAGSETSSCFIGREGS